ncbi:hypothetical protein N7499_010666 [Penicillium canescens]|uniref:Uncharacterized protein n=1 Tax=Penicillium canescens TaxID=5083 RepID=A0AAD6IIP3_PENCN|nr:uncharacterized protein N7446_005934 [Penicillium canescens]KAJ5990139.1 hypothetical protein N7522_010346 [Penicillium canescens]KAJ6051302.1 hypothetical protein N7460_001836 [Penicillium canescens]KAJ6061814.1 hypothetical protein N7446_005934 [Penicillium canescens]KAJ6065063.1 hypothetical protein N7444_000716 [Penicillium canescens]KAJ6068779.1 hypothetical protein N7499_010666 [Penicillium canescens]
MSEEITTAVELLESIGTAVNAISDNLGANRLDRVAFRKCLYDYSDRAASDSRLIDAARQNVRCANRALFLAQAHMELICWLAENNYTISSTSIKWYSWKKLFAKYRLPLLGVSSQTSHLRSRLQSVKNIASQVYTDLDDANIPTVLDSIVKYRKIRGPPVESPPEAIQDLIHRAIIARKQLSQ